MCESLKRDTRFIDRHLPMSGENGRNKPGKNVLLDLLFLSRRVLGASRRISVSFELETMASRSRSRRVAQTSVTDSSPLPEASTPLSRGRSRKIKVELEIEDEVVVAPDESIQDKEEGPVAGPSRRGRGRGRGGAHGRGRGRAKVEPELEGEGGSEDAEGEVDLARRRRLKKSIRYREIPTEMGEEEEADDLGEEVDGEGEEEAEGMRKAQ